MYLIDHLDLLLYCTILVHSYPSDALTKLKQFNKEL